MSRMGQVNNMTAGRIYDARALARSAAATTWGGTVQVIPHVTDEIKASASSRGAEGASTSSWCEIGGTVGDIESLPFLEAIRQLRGDVGREHTCFIHVAPVIYQASRRRGEDQARPAQREGAAGRRPRARHHPLPNRSLSLDKGIKEQDRALLQRRRRRRHHGEGRVDSIYEVPTRLPRRRASTRRSPRCSTSGPGAPDLRKWERAARGRTATPKADVHHCDGRQVRRPRPRATRASTRRSCTADIAQRPQGRTSSTYDSREARRSERAGRTSTASSCRTASARAAPRARSVRSSSRVSSAFPTSASATACRWP